MLMLSSVSKILRFVLFADDTNLFSSGRDLDVLCHSINEELKKLNLWFKVNKLSLNLSKTNYMIFSNVDSNLNIDLNINGSSIERVHVTKFLGCMIDSKLNWKYHVQNLKQKLAKCTSVLYKASFLLDTDSLRVLYCSLFLPYITYCSEVWGMACRSVTNCIFLMQKKVIRIICKSKKYSHTNVLFQNIKLLKFHDLVDLKVLLVVYKAKHNLLPRNIQSRFITKECCYNLRQKQKFKTVYVRTNSKARCISIAGTKLFDSLPLNIKNVKHIHMFKKVYKKFIFDKYQHESL